MLPVLPLIYQNETTMETWRFLYTKESSYKKATNKNGSLKRGKSKFIITEGINYSECLIIAKKDASFNDNQLIGSIKIS